MQQSAEHFPHLYLSCDSNLMNIKRVKFRNLIVVENTLEALIRVPPTEDSRMRYTRSVSCSTSTSETQCGLNRDGNKEKVCGR